MGVAAQVTEHLKVLLIVKKGTCCTQVEDFSCFEKVAGLGVVLWGQDDDGTSVEHQRCVCGV